MLYLNLKFDGKYYLEENPGISIGNYGSTISDLLENVKTINGKPASQYKSLSELSNPMDITWNVIEPVIPRIHAEIFVDSSVDLSSQLELHDSELPNHYLIYDDSVLKLWNDEELLKEIENGKVVIIDAYYPISMIPLYKRLNDEDFEEYELIELANRALVREEIHGLLAELGEHYSLPKSYDGQSFIGVDKARQSDLGYTEVYILSMSGTFNRTKLHIPTFMLYKSYKEIESLKDSLVCKLIKEKNDKRIAKYAEYRAFRKLMNENFHKITKEEN